MSRLRQALARLFGRAASAEQGGEPPASEAPLPTPERIVVGLGNPGPKYAETRHNVGFRVVERLAERAEGAWRSAPALDARVAPVTIAGRACLLVQPQTFVNRSGRTVEAILDRWPELDPAHDLVVVYDDLDLPVARLRLRPSGGHGGHNGLRDILAVLDRRDVPRLRFGVGHPGARGDAVVDWVLTPFAADEQATLEAGIERAADAIEATIADGIEAAMGRFNAAS